jgi:putative beta-lysine N-acetyltransferase
MNRRATQKNLTNSKNDTHEAQQFERFPPPLHEHLTTLDAHNARIKMFGVTAEVLAKPEARELLRKRFDENDAFTKLTAYASDEAATKWKNLGFSQEGRISNFFRDGTDAVLWARYSDEERASSENEALEKEVLELALSKEPVDSPILPGEFDFRFSKPRDADRISALLQKTFSDYPVDTSADVLRKLILRKQLVFGLVEHGDQIVSMGGAEIDVGWKTARISECVTVEEHRRRRLMVVTLDRLVDHVASRFKVTDFYSLARAEEAGMNAALARAGFTHDGRLVNNARMPQGWETLNVWWRTVHGDE